MYRAAHQELEGGRLFADPFAMRILGNGARQRAIDFARERPTDAPVHRLARQDRRAERSGSCRT
jgi:hypothetical protein